MDMLRPTYAQIDLSCIRHNARALKRAVGGAMLMAVVKANAYGHGMRETAAAVLSAGADWLGVASVEEGMLLRQAGITAPVCVIGGVFSSAAAPVLQHGLSQAVFNADVLHALQQEARRQSVRAKAHLKVDTGMNRVGVRCGGELSVLLDAWRRCPDVEMEGIFTHFAASDEADKRFSKEQSRLFMQCIEQVRAAGHRPICHAANSGAILDLPDTHFDMVRAGISLYGYYPSAEVKRDVPLQPAMTLKSRVLHVKTIAKGEAVSYGLTYTAKRDTILATIPAGYGDGYPRLLSNRADVLIRGQRARLAGRVCMDQIMADVTDIAGVGVGDEVVLLGRQGGDCVDADELAGLAGTISYEILLSVSARIPRVYIEG